MKIDTHRISEKISRFESMFLSGGFLPYIKIENNDVAQWSNQQKDRVFFKEAEKLASAYFPKDCDEYFMAIALLLSHSNISAASPNPSVGAVITLNNQILSWGVTEEYGKRHAEAVAIGKLTALGKQSDIKKLSESQKENLTVYVTLEPCSHFGKQPPCLDALAKLKPARAVISIEDPDPKMSGSSIEKLKSMGIETRLGVLAHCTSLLLGPFLKNKVSNSTFIAAKWAQSLDGCLADNWNHSQWISGPEARRYSHWLRYRYDAIIIGAGTALHDKPSLNIRENFQVSNPGDGPIRMIFDPVGSTITSTETKTLFSKFCGSSAPSFVLTKKLDVLKERKAKSLEKDYPNLKIVSALSVKSPLSDFFSTLHSKDFAKKLGLEKTIGSCLVEGGPRLLSEVFSSVKVDQFHIFLAPIFLGGKNNIIQNRGFFPLKLHEKYQLSFTNTVRLGKDLLVEPKERDPETSK